jgi:23S rRNA (guanosine2251-2'-O)-methyltransferase
LSGINGVTVVKKGKIIRADHKIIKDRPKPPRAVNRPKVIAPQGRLIYGKNTVGEVLRHRGGMVREVWLSRESTLVTELTVGKRISVHVFPREVLDEVTGGGVHQGFVAWVNERGTSLKQLIGALDRRAILLCADGINDPQNLGSLFRAAECFGVSGVLYSRSKGATITPVVSKVAVGAAELVPSVEVANIKRALDDLKEAGFWVVTADVGEHCTPVWSSQLPDRIVLVVGEEGDGVGRLISESSDFVVTIPMFGVVDSLNVAQSAAVMLYEIQRQRALTIGI